jgi:hypothetical protein
LKQATGKKNSRNKNRFEKNQIIIKKRDKKSIFFLYYFDYYSNYYAMREKKLKKNQNIGKKYQ